MKFYTSVSLNITQVTVCQITAVCMLPSVCISPGLVCSLHLTPGLQSADWLNSSKELLVKLLLNNLTVNSRRLNGVFIINFNASVVAQASFVFLQNSTNVDDRMASPAKKAL